MMAENKQALIIFSRLPIGRETKTRLAPFLSEKQREELHLAMWKSIFSEVMKLQDNTDIFLYWTGSGDIKDYSQFIPKRFFNRNQNGQNLGERMCNAMREIFSSGYNRAALIGSDIPELKHTNIIHAFEILNENTFVLGPSNDGGYWLIGMNKFIPDVFNIKTWGNSDVLSCTIKKIEELGIKYSFTDVVNDIDTYEDLRACLAFQTLHYRF
ncbi:MAG: TIGR04282 family arsenosugar biosynthesis glycosyltransferase [Synergistaceae bacterium]|nr:TIGR04282 family arsenosugar biosynthesis glycosyltransferase [Synergistaceae bacterium]MBQ7067537.1 TIGR04282 family arsenosugar biosynthesis glycosyltransferase [Synergistaceae bacterium]MBR0079178.1 TIGR04282 family arsenosugar biosynthesis glycosyltransferase [Synergistaceae bacterium]